LKKVNLSRFRQKVFDWFSVHARSLPWRGTTDPYQIWVSEIMLQQTTTKTVESYFSRFIERFPTVQALAASGLDEVNHYWEGLGYYRRAAQMHKAAQVITEQFGGVFPRTYKEVLNLPGIGRYTAGAVLSLAFGERLPILEANTIRLYSRLTALQEETATAAAQKKLWEFAETILPKKNSGQFNLALMDIGNAVCTPREPHCRDCPAASFCEAAALGLQDVIPVLPPKEEKHDRTEVALLVRKRGKILMIRYPQGKRWAGLWDFPRAEAAAEIPLELVRDSVLQKRLTELTGRTLEIGNVLTTMKHSVTKYRITLFFCEGNDLGKSASETSETCEVQWKSAKEIETLPLHSTARKLAVSLC
jgi:A/G-specific adenine glycosylase